MEKEEKKKNFLAEHVDTIVVLGAILSSVLWINGEFTDVRKDISNLRIEVAVMKTILQINKTCSYEMAKKSE